MNQALAALVPKLSSHRVLVVGDVILDEYLTGRANRLSREAPIPVLEFERREYIPGGAANPAANIAALGSQPIQVGVVGADPDAAILQETLHSRGIDASGLVRDPSRPTTKKTRIMAHMGLHFPQQVARIDYIARHAVNSEIEAQVLACLDSLAADVHVIMVSDYLSGLLTKNIVGAVHQISRERNILATADAQGELGKY